jgi:putative Mg2+ transporter-C (MgtC) family protein
MFSKIFVDPLIGDLFMKLAIAMLCGVAIGTERIIAHKVAGMRTYALVAMGSALFVSIADMVFQTWHNAGVLGIDPFHIPAAIITGVGFMGAGIFILKGSNVTGLTTASGLWVAAGIGMASGYGLFAAAILTTLLTLFVFIILWYVEQAIRKVAARDESGSE